MGSVAPFGAGIDGVAGIIGVMPAGAVGGVIGAPAGRAGAGVPLAGGGGVTGGVLLGGGGVVGGGWVGIEENPFAPEPAVPTGPFAIPLPAVVPRGADTLPTFVAGVGCPPAGPATSSAPQPQANTNTDAKTHDRTTAIETSTG
jgi:hypothetical protein